MIVRTQAEMESRARAKLNRACLNALEEEGQSLIEMAMVLPVMLLVVTGIMTFGLAFNNYVLLTEATSVAARTIAVSRGQTLNPCSTASQAVYSAAPMLTQSNLNFTFVLNGTTYTGASCASSSTTSGAAGNLVQGTNATVTVTYPCSVQVFKADYAPNCTLTAQMTEWVQ